MIKFFLNFKIIFYFTNFILIFLYLFPGSLIGLAMYGDLGTQPKITPDYIVSSNHFYVFLFISIIGFFAFKEQKQKKYLITYLIILSIILEIFHLFIPARSFEWGDLFGNLFGVVVVIFFKILIKKYGMFKD